MAKKTTVSKKKKPAAKKKVSKKKKKAPARSKATGGGDLDLVYRRLRDLLRPYAAKLAVGADTSSNFTLEGTKPAYKGKPMFFAGARRGRQYVSFYLFPVYVHPGLLKGLSPALKKRMQGKSCFNFTAVDEALLSELETLTAAGHARFEADGVL